MKTLIALAAVALMSVSCMTTYTADGRPVQTVDPGVAAAGVVAGALLGYALADDEPHYYHRPYRSERYYYFRPRHRGPYYRHY